LKKEGTLRTTRGGGRIYLWPATFISDEKNDGKDFEEI